MVLDSWDQLLFLFLMATLTASEHRLPLLDVSMLFSEVFKLPLWPASRKMAAVEEKPRTVSLEKTINISSFLTKHTLFTPECKYFMTCNWQFWTILVCLENCSSVKNPTLHTQLTFQLHNSLNSI